MTAGPGSALAARLGQRGWGALASAWFGRPFARGTGPRVCLWCDPNPVAMAQIYPFLHDRHALKARYGADIRVASSRALLSGAPPRPEADIAILQTWFDVDRTALARAAERLGEAGARVVFLDVFAHNDLRLARALEDRVGLYLKKSILRDRSLYFRTFRGDTNLVGYYNDLYGLPGGPVDWHVPEGFPEHLRLSPNFFTAPALIGGFGGADPGADTASRPIDLHARLGLGRDPDTWYGRMRRDALARAEALAGLRVAGRGRVPAAEYTAELAGSKLCFSPFGYGELCWRDLEAMAAGAVLVKPDMGHLETLPDLYEPGVTYLPVRWDFADLEEVVRGALADPEARRAMAAEAHARVKRYLDEDRFVEDMAVLFTG